MRLKILFVTLIVSGCSRIPEYPSVDLWTLMKDEKIGNLYFYGTNNKDQTKEYYMSISDGAEKPMICVSMSDYIKIKSYEKVLEDEAKKRCK